MNWLCRSHTDKASTRREAVLRTVERLKERRLSAGGQDRRRLSSVKWAEDVVATSSAGSEIEQVSAKERLWQNRSVPERGWNRTCQCQREAETEQVSARERLGHNRSVPEGVWDRTGWCQKEVWLNRLEKKLSGGTFCRLFSFFLFLFIICGCL